MGDDHICFYRRACEKRVGLQTLAIGIESRDEKKKESVKTRDQVEKEKLTDPTCYHHSLNL